MTKEYQKAEKIISTTKKMEADETYQNPYRIANQYKHASDEYKKANSLKELAKFFKNSNNKNHNKLGIFIEDIASMVVYVQAEEANVINSKIDEFEFYGIKNLSDKKIKTTYNEFKKIERRKVKIEKSREKVLNKYPIIKAFLKKDAETLLAKLKAEVPVPYSEKAETPYSDKSKITKIIDEYLKNTYLDNDYLATENFKTHGFMGRH